MEFSLNLSAIYTKWCAQLFRRFLDFSQFLTAISRKLWRHLATSMRTSSASERAITYEKTPKTASKSAYKLQRNACSNYAPLERTLLRTRSVTKNKHQFSHLQPARIARSSPNFAGDRARRSHQKGVIHF